jgi:hypothetical protein
MSTKTKAPPTGGNTGADAASTEPREYRSNPEIDAKIDAYIKENPKYWAYIQALPRERLERSLVLTEVQKLDRQQRIRDGIMKEIGRNPELKQAYETLLKGVPENLRDTVMAQVASQAKRVISRSQRQVSQTVG